MADMMQYAPGTGLFHRTNAVAKIIFTAAMLFAAVLTNDIAALAGLVVLVLAAAAFSGLLKELLKQIPLLIVLSLLLVVLTVLTMPSGDVLFYLIPAGYLSESARLPITAGAVGFAAAMSLRFAVLVFSFQIFVMSTQPRDMVNALYKMHVPGDYALMFLIAMRFIPTLQREGIRINEAQLSRGYAPHGGLIGKIEQLGPVVLPMMLNAVAKADTLGLTIDMRGYRKNTASKRKIIYTGTDYVLILFSAAVIAVLLAVRFCL